MAFNFLTG
jgi:hypothetical protein